jgi:hypothetical protein
MALISATSAATDVLGRALPSASPAGRVLPGVRVLRCLSRRKE